MNIHLLLLISASILLLILCETLSLAPFTQLLTHTQLVWIYGLCTGFLAVTSGFFCYIVNCGHISFALIKHAFLLWCALSTVVNILVLPRYFREWIFSSALVTLFQYLTAAAATFLTYRHFGWDDLEAYVRMELLSLLMFVVFYRPIRKLVVKTIQPFLTYGDNAYWHSVFLIPVAMLLACYFVLPGNAHMETPAQLLSRLCMVVTAFFICNSIAADFSSFQEKQTMEEQLRQQKLHYSSMSANLESARRQRHDFKHHLATIKHYIEIDNIAGLREYCGELSAQDEMQKPIPYSGNSAADGVIYHYMRQCAQENIHFTFQGTIHSDGIADTDLCVLLGNALDNALAGCRFASEQRFIHVMVQSELQLLSVLIQNSFDGVVVESETGTLLSRRRRNREGVGFSSMDAVCRHYGGTMERSWEENTFTLCILLPLPPKES